VETDQTLPPHVPATARQIRDDARAALGRVADRIDDSAFRRAVLAGYPDRVARRRAPRSDRFVLATGTGARLARESGVHDAEFVVAVDVTAGRAGAHAEAIVRLATAVEREWLVATHSDVRHELRELREDGAVRAVRQARRDALVLSEHPVAIDPAETANLIAREYLRREMSGDDRQIVARARFAGVALDWPALVGRAAAGARRLADVSPAAHLTAAERAAIDRGAPARFALPSGRSAPLVYEDDGRVVLRVKLQELFGVTDTPRLGAARVPLTVELLAPNGRPVQVTGDLASFWVRVYPTLRPALKARYPKHRW
jgi:ATP-dependent helicase HrpB